MVQRVNKLERPTRYVDGAAIVREDSDDELGLEDHPWQWIYEPDRAPFGGPDQHGQDHHWSGDEETVASIGSKRKYKAKNNHVKRPIIGAQMGDFSCKIGDCVLLKAEGNNEAWVGMICEFIEEEESEMTANFMWFSTEKEVRNKAKKRMDFIQNELYITPSWDFNPLASINGKAKIMSAEAYFAKFPSGKIPRSSQDYGKTFVCRRGCNTRTATYTPEFKWEEIFTGTEDDVHNLIAKIKSETKASRKPRSTRDRQDQDETYRSSKHDDELRLQTPSKKRKVSSVATPQKPRTPSKSMTPNHKRIVVKRPLEFTPLGTRMIDVEHIQSSPFQIARSQLHVSAVPMSLPCREAEFSEVYSHLETAISDGTGACIYISGTPGTGKTATVREVIAQLNASVMAEELDDFIFVEINGMKVTDPHQSYSLLWEALRGDRVSPSQALDLLEREFSNPSPRRVPCVVLMDELDQLVTKNQSVMYNFFNWPGLRHSRLIVLAVANTMDLPERTLSNKISSRLGMHRITFGGYNHEQLMSIIQSRLEGVPGGIVDPDAVQFASRKVAAVSGDARRALDICRRAVELAEMGNPIEQPNVTPGNKLGMHKPASQHKVTIATIKRAINEATSNPLQQYLKGMSLSSKLLLVALLARIRRTGLQESLMGDIIDEAKRIGSMAARTDVLNFLLVEPQPDVGRTKHADTGRKAARVLAMGLAAVELTEAGIVGMEFKKGERMGRIRLCIGEEDIKQALKDDVEAKTLGIT